MRVFAPNCPKNDKDWFLFPRDDDYRKAIFPVEVMKHVARANLYMVQAIIEYVSDENQTILDVMAGSGSIMVAALVSRRVICLDIEDEYYQLLLKGIDRLEEIAPGISTYITAIHGNCLRILPIPVDHIIFSPPYAQIMRMKKPTGIQKEMYGDEGATYQKTEGNVGRLNRFLYNQQMEKVYKKCYDSLSVGGTLSVIIKDYVEKQRRVSLSDWVIRSCSKMGFQLDSWHKWKPPGTFFHTMREARGELVVDEEDILILRKGGTDD